MQRYITVNKSSYIAPLGMCGPIVFPIGVEESVAYKTVVSGFETYEYNRELKKTIRLTTENFYNEDRFGVAPKTKTTAKVASVNAATTKVNKEAKPTPVIINEPVTEEVIETTEDIVPKFDEVEAIEDIISTNVEVEVTEDVTPAEDETVNNEAPEIPEADLSVDNSQHYNGKKNKNKNKNR